MFITAYAETFGYTGNGSYIYHVEQLSISSKIKVMTVNPTLNNHLLLVNKLNHLFDLEYLSKDELDDIVNCVTLHRQLEFKQLTINK